MSSGPYARPAPIMTLKYPGPRRSADMLLSSVFHMCQWVSTSPGATIMPSAVSSAVPAGTASSGPTAAIRPPSMCTSAAGRSPARGSIVSTYPPRMTSGPGSGGPAAGPGGAPRAGGAGTTRPMLPKTGGSKDPPAHGRHGPWPNSSPGVSCSGTRNASCPASAPMPARWRGSPPATGCSTCGPPRWARTGWTGPPPAWSPTTPTAASGCTPGRTTGGTCSTCRTPAATRTGGCTTSTWRPWSGAT